MALATKCPHCNTVFRVAHDQLKLRGGIVRCGHCNEVFDGNAALLAPPAAAPTPPTPPAPVSAPVPTPTPVVSASTAAAPAAADHSAHDPLAALPQLATEAAHEVPAEQAALPPAPPEPEPEPAPAPAPEPHADPAAQPLPAPTPFDAKMAALDTRAAEVLQSEPAASEPELELDTAIELDVAAAPTETSASAYQGVADPLELPPAPALAPATAEPPLELDLDIEPEQPASSAAPASAASEPDAWLDIPPEPAPEPADLPPPAAQELRPMDQRVASQWQDTPAPPSASEPALEQELALETMSDADLEAALAAELAVMERSIGADADQHDSGGTSARSDTRIEPSFDAPLEPLAPASGAASPGTGGELHALDDDDDTLVELSSASKLAGEKAQSAQTSAELDLLLQPARTTEAAASADAATGEEPGFIKRDRRRQKYGKAVSIAMALGSVALVGTLGIQGVTTFRNQLAAAMPPLKPALTAACNALGCKIELPAQIDDLNIEQGELQTLSDTTFSFNTLLRNQSTTAQSWPHIELVLDDANDKAVLRRVFTPRDYLGPDVPLDKGFAPHTEQAVKLFFELNQLKASGYHIAVFYP